MTKIFILLCLCLKGLVIMAQHITPTRLLADEYQSERLEQAIMMIVAINVISSSNLVEYKAGQAVTLMPGFETKAGAIFLAHTGVVAQSTWPERQSESFSITTYPNPFDEVTTIVYVLDKPARMSVLISDAGGKVLTRLIDDCEQMSGRHEVEWRSRDLPGGTYICTLDIAGQRISKRIIRK